MRSDYRNEATGFLAFALAMFCVVANLAPAPSVEKRAEGRSVPGASVPGDPEQFDSANVFESAVEAYEIGTRAESQRSGSRSGISFRAGWSSRNSSGRGAPGGFRTASNRRSSGERTGDMLCLWRNFLTPRRPVPALWLILQFLLN